MDTNTTIKPLLDCYKCGTKQSITIQEDGSYYCSHCRRTVWRKPTQARTVKPVIVPEVTVEECGKCGEEIVIDWDSGRDKCGCGIREA